MTDYPRTWMEISKGNEQQPRMTLAAAQSPEHTPWWFVQVHGRKLHFEQLICFRDRNSNVWLFGQIERFTM